MSGSHKLPSKGRVLVGTAKVAGRFVAGRDLKGGAKTDAGWRRKGSTVLTGTGHATRWSHLPHWQRSAARLSATATTCATTFGLVVDPAAVAATAQVGAWGASSWIAYAIGDGTYRYAHRRQYEQPLAEVLGPVVGWPVGTPPSSWITVPHGHREDPDKVVALRFPTGLGLTDAKKKTILGLARPLLGLHGADAEWLPGAEPSLELRAAPSPPDLVDLASIRAAIDAAPWNEPVLGRAAKGVVASMSYAQDSPHVLASIGSGGGKSTLAKAVAAPFRRRGGAVKLIDIVKRGASAKWAKGVDGIEVVRSPARAHELLLDLAEEVSARCERAWHNGGPAEQTPILLVVEEANATQRLLQRYWTEELEGAKASPAVASLADVLCVGREADVYVMTFAQQGTAKATGGGDARENYGTRILARFTRNTAKMLVPEVGPHLRSSRHPGRVQVVQGGDAVEVQVAFLTDDEARELAVTGVPVGPLSGTLSADSPAHTAYGDGDKGAPAKVLEFVPRQHPPLADEPELPEADPLVSLAEAADGMVVGETHEALKKARSRARAEGEPFPPVRGRKGRTELFRPAELRAWALNRPGPGQLAGARSGGGEGS